MSSECRIRHLITQLGSDRTARVAQEKPSLDSWEIQGRGSLVLLDDADDSLASPHTAQRKQQDHSGRHSDSDSDPGSIAYTVVVTVILPV